MTILRIEYSEKVQVKNDEGRTSTFFISMEEQRRNGRVQERGVQRTGRGKMRRGHQQAPEIDGTIEREPRASA